jgi:hypothetical protein
VGLSPWWYSSSGEGRFDLAPPWGTLYAADDVETAVRERLRERVVAHGVVSPALAATFEVSAIEPGPARCAHVSDARAARHGVTRELVTMLDYEVPRAWAAWAHREGFDGVRYASRFTTGSANAWALFGEAGQAERPAAVPRTLPGAAACAEAGLIVAGPPRLAALRQVGG